MMNESLSKEMSVTQEKPSPTPLLKNRSFLMLIISIIFSSLATSTYLMIETWYVSKHLQMPSMLGYVLMATAIPRLLLMSVGGVVADRFKRSLIMFYSDFFRFVLLLAMTFLFLSDQLTFTILIIFALLFGVLESFYWPAASSIIPTIVPDSQLGAANSYNFTIQQVGVLVGPVIAGMSLTWGSYDWSFGLISVMLLLGSVFLLGVRDQPQQSEPDEVSEEKQSMLAEIKEGFLYIKEDRFKFSILLTNAISVFFLVGPLSIAIPTFVTETLNGTAMDFTYLEISLTAGSLIGAIVIGMINITKQRAMWSYIFMLFFCFSMMGLGFAKELIPAIIALLFTGIFSSFANTTMVTALQSIIDMDKMGRVMSLFTMASTGLVPISQGFIPMILNKGVSLSHLLIAGSSITCVFLISVLLLVKTIRSQ